MSSKATFIKTRNDQIRWDKALNLARRRWKERDTNTTLAPIENIWAYANWLFQHNLGDAKSLVAENKGLISSQEDNNIYEAIRFCTFSDKNKETLDEEEKYNIVEETFNEYKKIHENNTDRKTILEFVNTYGRGTGSSSAIGMGTMNGASYDLGSKIGVTGFGGYRDESPKGPYIYGFNSPGSDTTGINKDNAIVVIPDKKDDYKPSKEMDNQGNLVTDVQNSQQLNKEKKIDLEQQLKGPLGELLTYIEQNSDVTIDEVLEMDTEELQNLIKKLIKKDNSKNTQVKIQESIEIEDSEELNESNRNSSISIARNILSSKHKQKKANQKDGKKYILKQNDIIKLMSSYGYKFDKKYKKWIKKRSQTYDARRILNDKYQDRSSLEKDDSGKYKLDQDDIRKKMHAHNYFYDLTKKRWFQKFDSKSSVGSIIQPEPIQTVSKPYVPKPMIKSDGISKIEPVINEPIEKQKSKSENEPVNKEPNQIEHKPENPLNNYTIKQKMKEMQARFILNIINNDNDMTKFHKNEETDEYTPKIKLEDILNKMDLLQYEWYDDKNLWLDSKNTLPNKLFDIQESKKTLIARSYLAAIGKLNNIKVGANNIPLKSIEDIDNSMENQDFYYIDQLNFWKYIGEDEVETEIDEDITYSEIDESDYDEDKVLNEATTMHDYEIVGVGDMQARFLLRAIQLKINKNTDLQNKLKSLNDKSVSDIVDKYISDITNGSADDMKTDQNKIEEELTTLGFEFNEDPNFPMWTYNNKIPNFITNMGIDKKEYIARGILASQNKKNHDAIKFYSTTAQPLTPSNKIILRMTDTWDEKYGWKNQKLIDKEIVSKIGKKDWTSMNKEERDAYKKIKLDELILHADILPPDQLQNARNKLMKNYYFDEIKKQWIENESIIKTGLSKIKNMSTNPLKTIYSAVKGIGKGVLGLSNKDTKLGKLLQNLSIG